MNIDWTDPDVQKLVLWPNHVLKKTCELVTAFDEEVLKLAEQMWRTMKAANGIGIAAPQIGSLKSIICIATDDIELMLANPRLIPLGKRIESREGCLSFPGFFTTILRWDSVALKGDIISSTESKMGTRYDEILKGNPAIVAQHEIDHTKGITFVDHLSKLKRDLIRDKIMKSRKNRQ